MKDRDRHHRYGNHVPRHNPYNRPIHAVKNYPNGRGEYTRYNHDGRERDEHHGTTSHLNKKRKCHNEGPANGNKKHRSDSLNYYADKDPHKGIQFPNGKKQPHLYQVCCCISWYLFIFDLLWLTSSTSVPIQSLDKTH